MAWYSILPAYLTVVESWIIRFFILLAIINIAPWVIAILYDLILYIARRIWHEIPIWGGRARGDQRPRAHSLRDRVRRLSLADMIGVTGSPSRVRDDTRAEMRRRQQQQHGRNLSHESIEEREEETPT